MPDLKPEGAPDEAPAATGGMKSCFGRELAARFGPGTMPIGTDVNAARLECYGCPDLEHCAIIIDLVMQLRQRREEEKKAR